MIFSILKHLKVSELQTYYELMCHYEKSMSSFGRASSVIGFSAILSSSLVQLRMCLCSCKSKEERRQYKNSSKE